MRRLTLCFGMGAVLAAAGGAHAQRSPLTSVDLTRVEYPAGGTRERLNQKTHRLDKYDLDQKIVYEEKTGDFLLQWTGADGKRKTIVYHPANRLHAVVTARVERDATANGFRYVYAVRNLPNSQRELQVLYITIRADVSNAESPDATWGRSVPFTEYLRKVLEVPGGWRWAQTGGGRTGLRSGESAYGFAFQSSGLPAPTKCFVDIQKGMKGVGEEPPEELMAALDPVSWLVPRGLTVGPVAPPDKLEPGKFLTDIQGMVDTALEQGWILSPSLAKELKESLRQAASLMNGADSKAQRTALEEILKGVEEEKDKRLLSEAYAILKYNIEFILSRLEP